MKRDETSRKALEALREETQRSFRDMVAEPMSPAEESALDALCALDARLRLLEDDNG
jgi:hypothetical protein